MKRLNILILVGLVATGAVEDRPVAYWSFKTTPSTLVTESLEPGDEIDLVFTAELARDWIVYSTDFSAAIGPQPTVFEVIPDDSFEVVGLVKAVDASRRKEKIWGTDVRYFARKAEFRQRIRVLKPDYLVKGVIRGQYGSEQTGASLPFEQVFVFSIQ